MAHVLSVNLAVPRPDHAHDNGALTGIDKQPTVAPVRVQAPEPGASGLAGDRIFDTGHHGGNDQAVYVYAREDLDSWAAELGRELRNGQFGENLTSSGLEVTGALIGERWRVGERLILEVTSPRIPCRTFAAWMREQGWVKRFTARAVPGAYLRVIEPGQVRAGDPVTVLHRPAHDVTVGLTFRALTTEPELLSRLTVAEALHPKARAKAARRTGAAAPSPRR